MENNVLAIDLGFGSTKICYSRGGGQLTFKKFTSAVAEVQKDNHFEDGNIFTFDGGHYYVFDSALRLKPGSCIDMMSYEGLRKVSPIIIRKVMQEEGIEPDKLVLGLSLAMLEYSADYKTYVAEALNLDKDNIKLIPQGIGAKLCYDKKGLDFTNPNNSELTSSNYLGVDIGFNTVDVFQVIDGKASSGNIHGLEAAGISKASKLLIDELVNKGHNIDLQESKEVIQSGSLRRRGSLVDCKEEVTSILRSYLSQVVNELEDKFSNELNKVDNVIFFGGGAAILKKYLGDLDSIDEIYPEGFLKIVEKPEFFNVVGYYLRGAAL